MIKLKEKHQKLTDKQRDILMFIKKFRKDIGISPTIAEVSEYMGRTRNAAKDQLVALERKGRIKRIPNVARGIVLIGEK